MNVDIRGWHRGISPIQLRQLVSKQTKIIKDESSYPAQIYVIICQESELKETFRVFSKDDEGCISAEELKFVMTHLPGKVMVLVMV